MKTAQQPGSDRAQREIEHGAFLAQGQTETSWGWGTPAGARRAKKRGAAIARAAGLRAGIRVLEIGCGTGLFTQIFANTGVLLTANDISPDLVKIAQRNNPSVEFICAQFEELTETSAYDAIVGSSILHHLDVDRALSKCFSLLKPGGVIALAEPNMLNPQVFAERTFFRKFLRFVSPDETAFVRWPLAKKLTNARFADISIQPFDWLHPAIPAGLINLVDGVGKILETVPLIREFAGSLLISCRKP